MIQQVHFIRRKQKSYVQNTTMFIAALFSTAKTWKQRVSIDGRIKNMWCIYTIKYYSAIKYNEILAFAKT